MILVRRLPWNRRLLATLELLVGLVAVPAGINMIIDPSGGGLGLPLEWLRGLPFRTYLIPGLVLSLVIGGSMFTAVVGTIIDKKWAANASLAAGTLLTGWIISQLIMIGYVSWMQPVFFLLGLAIIMLSLESRRSK